MILDIMIMMSTIIISLMMLMMILRMRVKVAELMENDQMVMMILYKDDYDVNDYHINDNDGDDDLVDGGKGGRANGEWPDGYDAIR